jgi:hypothetical protein
MLSKPAAFVGVGMLLSAFAGQAQAEIYGVTGDLDVGPAQDFISPSIVCHDANVLFRMYERLPPDQDVAIRKEFFMSYYMPYIKKGECGAVPASTAYVTGIRTAMIKKGKTEPASKYVIARVVINGERLYVTPDRLQQTGFEIIKAAQSENNKMSAPLVQ